MVDSTVFLPLVIIAITQMIKMVAPKVNGAVTIAVAFAVGIVVALIDGYIGVTDITIAGGIVAALTAIGVTVLAAKAGGGAKGDETNPVK